MFENTGVGEVESLPEYYAVIVPFFQVKASGAPNLSLVSPAVHDLEEEPVLPIVHNHERVGYEAGIDIGDILRLQYGVDDLLHWYEGYGISSFIEPDRPPLLFTARIFLFLSLQAVADEECGTGSKDECNNEGHLQECAVLQFREVVMWLIIRFVPRMLKDGTLQAFS